jgi:hypothetical protein
VLGKHTLNPKEKTSLKITFRTEGSPGPFRKVVTISTDIPGQEEVEVTVEGIVKEGPGAKIQVSPRRLDLGAIPKGTVKRLSFTVANGGTAPLVITRVYSKDRGALYFEGAGTGAFVVEPGGTRTFELDLTANETGGGALESVVLESNAKNAPKGGYVVQVHYTGS